ncbi:methylenetetrahydrofolate reductase [Coprothermobacter platensis]|uniref:methylenetetrahydrofolate reductase n=1 Tax=Coprothermobacter platensis TaxID=108819 RepID=UPI00035DC51C|nr:methylenetetrahydrofolate reductase [Coprothermobacter platensis]
MKVVDKIKEKQIISIEVLPPNRGHGGDDIFRAIDELMEYPISFINVTRHAPELTYVELSDGNIIKVPKVKRPGTVGLTAALMKRYAVDVVPHVLCLGMNKYELEDLLIDFHLIGIENVFAIRGEYDNPATIKQEESKDTYKHSVELVKQIKAMNRGQYLYQGKESTPTDFCVGVAGYPEKHFECTNLEQDIKHLKEKVDAGADYVITQMVFDFDVYKNFVEKAQAEGINVPIIPGIKPIISLKSIYSIPRSFFVSVPNTFVSQMEQAQTKSEEFNVGTAYMASLVEKLLSWGAPGIHLFTMGKSTSAKALLKAVLG